jgi:hypothetical protein
MKFKQFLNETTTGEASYEKYFKGKEIITTVKSTSNIFDISGKKIGTINADEEVIVPSTTEYSPKINIIYKNKSVYINFNNLRKVTTKGGEQLRIQASKLLGGGSGKTVTIGHLTFSAQVFNDINHLKVSLYDGIQKLKSIPNDLKSILLDYTKSNNYSTINWNNYDNTQLKNEVAKYLGEIMIGLITMNNEHKSITGNNPFLNKKVKEFIMPTSTSFKGVDSLFSMTDGTIIPISSKSGKGAPASFHGNVMPILLNNKDITIPNGILKFMINYGNYENIEFLYHTGIGYIMEPYIKNNPLGKKAIQNPYSVYKNLSKNIITDVEEYLISIISDKKIKWPITSNMNTIISKLPGSFTYFLCQNIADIMNKDTKTMDAVKKALSYKNFYQANLNKLKFSKGIVSFNLVHSGSDKIKMIHGKGTMGSVKSEQGRLSYMIE